MVIFWAWKEACGGKYDWRAPNRVLGKQDSTDIREGQDIRAHAAPPGTCDNFINAPKLLTNQQKGGDNEVQESGKAKVRNRFLRSGSSGKAWMSSPCDRKKKVPSSKVGHKDGGFRQSTRIGTPSAWPFSKESKGQPREAMYYRYKDLHQAVKR